MDKQEILKILEEMIPENDEYTGDLILCLNQKDNYPSVYQKVRVHNMPNMLGKINAFMTVQYTMQFVMAEQERVQAVILENSKPEDKEGIQEMLDLFKGNKTDGS